MNLNNQQKARTLNDTNENKILRLSEERALHLTSLIIDQGNTALVGIQSDDEVVLDTLLRCFHRQWNEIVGGRVSWTKISSMSHEHSLDSVADMLRSCEYSLSKSGKRPAMIIQGITYDHPSYLDCLGQAIEEAVDLGFLVLITFDSFHAHLAHDLHADRTICPDSYAHLLNRGNNLFKNGCLQPYMSVREAAWILNVSESHLYGLIEKEPFNTCVSNFGKTIRLNTAEMLSLACLDPKNVATLISYSFGGDAA